MQGQASDGVRNSAVASNALSFSSSIASASVWSSVLQIATDTPRIYTRVFKNLLSPLSGIMHCIILFAAAIVAGAAVKAAPVGSSAIECVPGTYWHTRGSVDCGAAQGCPATGGTIAECCCDCHANFYCPVR